MVILNFNNNNLKILSFTLRFPLDWDRPWQAYPIPNIIGAITFQLISAFYTLFETMVRHKLGKKQH